MIENRPMKEHVAIVLQNSNNEVLFIKRSMKKKTLPGAWSFPSGTKENNESLEDTTMREAMEELGVKVNPKKIMSNIDLPEFSVRLFFMLCNVEEGEPKITEPDEIDELRWMTFNDFFNNFSDKEIGHGLVWLRKNPVLWGL